MFLFMFVLFFMYLIFKYRRRRVYELASNIPGYNDGLPIIGNALKFVGDNEQIMKTMKDTSYRAMKTDCGSFKFWIGSHLLIFMVEPVDVEVVLKTCLEKDDLHRFMRLLIGNGVVFAPVSIWKRRRKVIVPAFTPKIVESFVEVFSEQSQILSKQLEKVSDLGFFNVWRYLSSYTLDSVSETVLGTKIGAQTNPCSSILDSLDYLLDIASKRVFQLWLHPDLVFRFTSHHKPVQNNIEHIHRFTNKVIKQKRQEIQTELENVSKEDCDYAESTKARMTFLDLLINLSGKDKGYTDEELREEVLTLTVAGTDTSAVGMAFTLLLLGKHQDVQERAYQELLDVYGTSDRPVVKEDLQKLTYIEWIIKESLRLYPPVPLIIRKVEEEIKLPSGIVLPIGAGVCLSIWGIHRNPKYWGPNAEEFDPERFSPERYNLTHPWAFMPFSQGPRNCLGYQYAMMSAKTAMATLLRKYKILIKPELMKADHIKVKMNIMLKSVEGYNIALEKR